MLLNSIHIQYTHTQQRQAVYTGFPLMWRALDPDTLMRAGRVLTAGWSLPRVFSLMDSASLRRLAASLYLFWSLKGRKHFQSIYCYSLCNKGLLLRSSWEKAVSMTTGWWHNKPNVPNGLQTGYYHILTNAIEDKGLRPFVWSTCR